MRPMTEAERKEVEMYRKRAVRALDVIEAGVTPVRPDWLVKAFRNRNDPAFMAVLRRQAEARVE